MLREDASDPRFTCCDYVRRSGDERWELIDGEASRSEADQLKARLKADPSAKRELDELRQVDEATRAIPPAKASSSFRDRVLRGIRDQGGPSGSNR